jgi:hypothetical protein
VKPEQRAARLLLSCVTLRWEIPCMVAFGHLTLVESILSACPSKAITPRLAHLSLSLPLNQNLIRTTETPNASLTRPSGAPPGLDTPLERGADNEQGARGPGKSARGMTFTARNAAR